MSKSERTSTRRASRAILIGGAVSLAALGGGVTLGMFAGANPPASTTDVHFVALATPYKLFTAKSFAKNTSYSAVVVGGATKIPTNATTVEINLEVGGSTSGSLGVYPTGNPGGNSNPDISWGAGETNTETIGENVGLSDEVTFLVGESGAKATATILGYSTQVTDGDVSGLDGSSGQVLTDTGSGAAWANPSVGAGEITPTGGTSGQVLTNTGSAAAWETPPTTTTYTNIADGVAIGEGTIVNSVTVPAGTYVVTDSMEEVASFAVHPSCSIEAPDGNGGISYTVTTELDTADGYYIGSVSPNAVITTSTGGSISLFCQGGGNDYDTLIATPVGGESGPDVG